MATKMTDALSKLADPIQKLVESLMPLFERYEALAGMATNAANAINQMSASDIRTIAKIHWNACGHWSCASCHW